MDESKARSQRRGALAAALIACLAWGACGQDPRAAERDEARAQRIAERARAAAERGELDEANQTGGLRALGYVDYGETVDPSEGSGVVWHDAERAYAGYNLQTSIPLATARLFDMDGHIVKVWRGEDDAKWVRARLLDDGDLLVVGESKPEDPSVEPPPGTLSGHNGFLRRIGWGGETRWSLDIAAHHDVSLTPNGEILTLTEHVRPFGDEAPDLLLIDHALARVSLDGELLEEVSIYDLLNARPGLVEKSFEDDPTPEQKAHPRDLVHANSARWLPHAGLHERGAPFGPRSVLFSSRSQSLVAIVDWDTHELLWVYGGGKLRRQHEATWLERGTILVLDNGDRRRPWTRIVELDPVLGRVVWQYRADPPEDFFTPARGVAQALPGRRVLIGDSFGGRAFEVDREGRVLWRYLSPDVSDAKTETEANAGRASMRIERLPRSFVEHLLRKFEPK